MREALRTRAGWLQIAAVVLVAAFYSAALVVSPNITIAGTAVLGLAALAVWLPQLSIGVWLVATIAIPSWTVFAVGGVGAFPYYASIPVVLGVLARGLVSGWRPSWIDAGVTSGVGLVIAYQEVYGQATFLATNVVFALLGGYVLGRTSGVRIEKLFAIAMVVVAAWGIAEFLLDWHAFTTWQAENLGIGPKLQERGGLARSEASLGHAIAYGGCLAAAIPSARLLPFPVVAQVILSAGVAVSFSRGPIIAVVFTLAILLFSERSSQVRASITLLFVAGLAAAYVMLSYLYNGSAQGELQSSGSARTFQLDQLLAKTNLIGPADGLQLNSEGRYVTAGIDIVDSAPLRLALDFGWVATLLLLAPILAAIWRVLVRRAGRMTGALVGQIPVLLVTSFITQWQTIFFFVAGMAVTEMVSRQRSRPAPADASQHRETVTSS